MKAGERNRLIITLAAWGLASGTSIALVHWNGPAGLVAAVFFGLILGIYLMGAEQR